MAAGRPRKYQSPEELETACEAYFADCLAREKPITISGLGYWLGFNSRDTLHEYENRGDELSDVIKKARFRVEQAYEERLHGSGQVAGAIFGLKNIAKWTDKQELEHTGRVTIAATPHDENL